MSGGAGGRDGRRRAATVATLGVAAAALGPAALAAPAATFDDVPTRQAAQATTVTTTAAAARALAARGIVVTAAGGATVRGRRITVPTAEVDLTGRPLVTHGGSLRIRRGDRSLRLTDLRVVAGGTTTVTARLAGRRRTVLVLSGRRSVDRSTGIVRITGASARLTADARRRIARALGGASLPAGVVARVAVDADAGSDLPFGGVIDWGLSEALRRASDAQVARPAPAVSVFDMAICETAEGRDEGCDPDVRAAGATAWSRAAIHFPVIDASYRAATQRAGIEGQGGLRIALPASGRTVVIESPYLTITGKRVTLKAFVTVESADPALVVAQRQIDLATFVPERDRALRRGGSLAWSTGPGRLTAAGASALAGVLAPDAELDPLTVSTDAPVTD